MPGQLEVRGLTKRFSPQVTVGPLSFEVMEGEFFSLLGPSGCGKTTTLRCIAGFEEPSEGSVLLGGHRLDGRPPHRRDVGLVFQTYALFPHLTVFDNIAFGLRLRKAGKPEIERRVGQMLELVDLPNLAERYPSQLSGGQQQRVAIARSLVLEPSLLLFDEPLSNLDLKLRIQMRYELRDLQRRLGKTAVYVTHDQTEALALSDRIAVLSQGRIEQIGTPNEIYESPASAFVADFIGSSNLLTAWVRGQNGGDTTLETEHGLVLTLPRVADVSGATVTLLLRPERFQVAAIGESDQIVANRFRARVRDVTYMGEDLHLRVLALEKQPLLVSIKNSKGTRAIVPGVAIELAIDPEDIHILRR
ncbi:MAG: Fe3+/spermidine/putrescine ABC transporter ATP-binding protein [Candidatus Rokuibacteriota bacterium]|nr:MAG: Fe3+/spermidine/putrescine ABC transporter ATP-binding protein [Candidatus Rokubacteria bacterium]